MLGFFGIVSVMSVLSVSDKPFTLNCWDGTFAYNSINVVAVDDGYEVSFQGSHLGDFILSRNAMLVSQRFEKMNLHVKFPRGACIVDGTAIQCSSRNPG